MTDASRDGADGSTDATLRRLCERVAAIEATVRRIECKLDDTRRSCGKMDAHVDFVERVYDRLRRPLSLLAWSTSGDGRTGATRLLPDARAAHMNAASARPPATETLAMNP